MAQKLIFKSCDHDCFTIVYRAKCTLSVRKILEMLRDFLQFTSAYDNTYRV